MQLLDLEQWEGYWQCTDRPWLRLHERQFRLSKPSQRHVLTLAALRADLLATASTAEDETGALEEAVWLLHLYVHRFASRYALTALLGELDEQLAATRDLSQRATSQRSPKSLTQVQQQLINTGLDSQIVTADIARFANDEKRWKRDLLDFTKVVPPSQAAHLTSPLPLAETLRQSQIDQATDIAQAETDLRELINSSAQLTAAAENIRLQRWVRLLAIVSLIVAIIAAAATIAALDIAGNASTPAPTVHPSASRT